jgi:hypothetical protein
MHYDKKIKKEMNPRKMPPEKKTNHKILPFLQNAEIEKRQPTPYV